MSIQITREDFKRFAPKAKPAYVEALFANLDKVRAAGLLETKDRWCHFIGQCAAETDSFVILRESLDYRTVRAVRNAWRARASKHSDEWIAANLLRNPVALGDWAYGGREGNRKGTTDGFDFRGGGWLQTTHANAVRAYCQKCGIPFANDVLDDVGLTLQFALYEWSAGKCNSYADADDIVSIAKIINTGSAKSNVRPNGMDRRRQEVARAQAIWGDADDGPAEPTRLYAEVTPPSALKTAMRSKTNRGLFGGLLFWLTERLDAAFNFIPQISSDVGGMLEPLTTLASALKWQIGGLTTAIVVVVIVRAMLRHTADKQELETLKGE